jgi:hypothetical protein
MSCKIAATRKKGGEDGDGELHTQQELERDTTT